MIFENPLIRLKLGAKLEKELDQIEQIKKRETTEEWYEKVMDRKSINKFSCLLKVEEKVI